MKNLIILRKHMKVVINMVCVCAMLATYSMNAFAEDGNQAIRVGFFQFDGYHNITEDGTRSGYGYEFIQKMLRYNNHTAEYVGYDKNWSEMQEMLADGTIDVLTSAQKTPEREERFDFSEPIGTSAAILTVKAGNNTYSAEEYATYNGMRVGVIEGNSRNDRFVEFATEKHFTYTMVYYDDMDALTQALQDNEIDAIVTSNLRSIHNEWILDKFSAAPFYAMVQKGNEELLNQINYAIDQMNSNSVGWQDELFDRYYSGSDGEGIALSSTERQYLGDLKAEGRKIKVLVHPDRAPYSYISNGKAKGILPDIFTEAARRLELPYEYVLCDNRAEYYQLKKNGDIDVVLEARNDLSEAEDEGYKLTDPYMNLSYGIVERREYAGEIQSVATLKKGYTSDKNLDKFLEDKEVLYYENLQECIDAVADKKADASYVYDYTGQKYASENVKGNLQCTTVPDIKDTLAFAVQEKDDYRLLSVLTKAVTSVREDYVDIAVKNNTDFFIQNLTLTQFLWRNPSILIFLISMIAALLLLSLYIYLKSRSDEVEKEKNRQLEELTESLRDALETAKQASASKGSFLSNMSHEIRTPLNAMIGYLTLAKDKDITQERLMQCIDNSDIASRHLLHIINDILDMSSIESGKMKIAHEEFDLKKEISDITTIFFQNARAKGILFETYVNNLTEEWVIGDQLRLNQVLMNLLSNAVKFTPEQGKVQLYVQQLNEENDKVYIQFSVKDTGIGMSEEYMSRIFHPFEQENAGTAKRFGGSGLGLSITNNLIQMMGGTITVDSKQNNGTKFTVTMHFDRTEKVHTSVPAKVDYSNVRVLVVDDKEDECTYIKAMLKRCGVKADVVTSGEVALKRIKSRAASEYSYNLCIIDWNMPEMDGCEVTRRIRGELGNDVPVIIATAYDIGEFQEQAVEAGVNKIVAKPLFQSTMFDLLVSTFGKYDPEAGKETTVEQIDMTGVHILLAEDNPMNMDIAVTILEKAGITVEQAVNGEEAYQIFTSREAGTFDMVLMDVQMPVMDGYQATRAIRNSDHPEGKTIPIIAMTANAFAEDVTEALSNGMDAHIAKPINYDKLFALLQRFSSKN